MREALGYYAYRFLSGAFGLLPAGVVRRVGFGLGWLGSFIARDRFRMAQRHQARVGGEGPDLRRRARLVFAHYGRYWAETFWLRPRRHHSILERTTLEGVERLHAAIATGRGVIVALPHTGNWEVAGLRAAAEGARVLAVAEDLGNQRIVDWFVAMRNMMDIDIVIARKGGRVTRDLLERLGAGGVIALLADRDVTGRGVEAEFFGEITTMPAGPVALADRTGAVLLPVGIYFGAGDHHRFVIHPAMGIPAGDTAEERVRLGVAKLAGILEEIIRVAPEQWHLIVPNWASDRASS